MGQLTTHVLDTTNGLPGGDVCIDLFRLIGPRQHFKRVRTNQDGRTDTPLLEHSEFEPGVWELVFGVGDYFRRTHQNSENPAFLDDVVIRVTLASDDHYHVPLLVSPFAYSTYRGS